MTKTLKKGFTLVELIVVIAIIAILATVSVVGYSAFLKNANQSKVNQELAQAENVLRAEAVATVKVSLGDDPETDDPTLVMSLKDNQIKFTFTFGTTDPNQEDQEELLDKLIEKVELSTLEGNFTLTVEGDKAKLNYKLDDLSATLDVVLEVVEANPVTDPEESQ